MSGHKTKYCYKKKPITCFECGEAGHIKSYCLILKKLEGTSPKPAEGVKKNALCSRTCYSCIITANDIVLGMDWLTSNQARILCDKKAIEFQSPQDNIITINRDNISNSVGIISMLKATKYLIKRCLAYLVSTTTDTKKKMEEVPVVAELPDVFPD
ncbi:hypothetical protein L1987_24192 [Smallanthus sonchifolius]|uniref:Uncharacterized protein n=1 Tax=Smallanthus sonchifolius TaxID=185202 RepID=A0ACB9IKN4_9ASTR|nr:hypothetical protein L1987_24192 [Smallanthus sonchifolius]